MVSVELPEPVTDDGLNELLVRLGRPLTWKLTEEEKGPIAVVVTVNVVEDFRETVALVGEAVTEKSATTSVTCVVCVSAPLVAVIVSGYEPGGVDVDVDTDSVEARPSDGVIEFALKLAFAPVGSPATLKLTGPWKPLEGVTFTL